ncbi:rubredoxin [Methanobrevibacter sp.]|uniref:rubredoxin n=1 Tax=Methanobrevibacter sp. TaxID=66852 RepID=UPI0026DF3EEB|nr:rubredoxin [Methanobrevibacter sp.]MDO5860893.1 rubredoxin [Methanobrevibacter sp.]
MAIYKCKICGYTFDESNIEEGLNIPEGTKFDDLPSSFKCPKCRMAKGMFEKVD